ncbi:MAG: N-acetylmuramic acid 6-phosphate etherase [Planctomycetota bacterium]
MSERAPIDRGDVETERRNPRTLDLSRRDVHGVLQALGDEDEVAVRAVAAAREELARLVEAIEPGFVAGGRLVYVGAGTSGRLGVLDASEAPPTFGVERGRVVGLIAGGDAALRESSESAEDELDGARERLESLGLGDRDAVVGVAASGSTPYVLGALVHAKRLAPRCVTGLVCCVPRDVPPGCDHVVRAVTGPEALTGSTRLKAGTATKLVLNAISTTLMVRAGRTYGNLMVDVRATNAKLRDRAARIVATVVPCDRARAFELLERAGGEAKVAVVVGRLGLDAAGARARLADVGGRLDALLDEVRP